MAENVVLLKRKRGLDEVNDPALHDKIRDIPTTPAAPLPVSTGVTMTTSPADETIVDQVLSASWTVVNDDIANSLREGDADAVLIILKEEWNAQKVYVALYELVLSAITARISLEVVASTLNSMLASHNDIESMLADTLSAFEYSSALGTLIVSLNMNRAILKQRLDASTLVSMKFESSMFPKLIRRAVTTELYKQKRFNLLREESEGYSKLIVEIHAASYLPFDSHLAQRTAKKLVSIIGYFDLDPNRALDIYLDVFAANLVANCTFFLELLKAMPWWPRILANISSLENLTQKGGNSIAASLLGFKLEAYSRDNTPAPDNLIMMISLLVKEGFLSFLDIYPYFSPSDEAMLAEKEIWKKDLEESAFLATASALALAAPLQDEGVSQAKPERPKEKEKEHIKRPGQLQKVQLVSSLLSVGAIWPAVFLLSKFPFLPAAFPDVADILNLVLLHMISPFYESIRPISPLFTDSENAKLFPKEYARQLTLVPMKSTSNRRVLNPLKRSDKADTTYRFFYETWTRGVPMIHSQDDLFAWSEVLVKFTGSQLSRETVLFSKLCRIVNHYLDLKENDDIWLQYFRTYLLPALSLIESNPGVMHEVARVLFHFEYPTRYSVYGEWYTVLLKNQMELRVASSKAEKETKNILKRLSKTNVSEMMLQLSRVSIANPITSLIALVSQVESYDNLSDLVVAAAQYFTEIGWDVLPFVIMMQLASGRGTVQVDGVTERKWLQSLASFTAKLCKEYPSMNSLPLLEYLRRQLHKSDSSDILLLQEMMEQMAGIVPLTNLTDAQLEGLSAGNLLRAEVLVSIGDKRHSSDASARRLLQSLLDLGIISELFILLAQQYKTAIFTIPDYAAHTKILGARYDDLGVILSQFIEFLTTFLLHDASIPLETARARFVDVVYDVPTLCNEFGVDSVIAFYLWRDKLSGDIKQYDAARLEESERRRAAVKAELTEQKASDAVTVVDADMTDADNAEDEHTKGATDVEKKELEPKAENEIQDKPDVAMEDDEGLVVDNEPGVIEITELEIEQALAAKYDSEGIWHPVLTDIMNRFNPPTDSDPWKYVTKGLFVTFWQLSLNDIQMTLPRYSAELDRLREAIRLSNSIVKSERDANILRQKRQEREKLMDTVSRLNNENRDQVAHFGVTLNRLRKEKDHWFPSVTNDEEDPKTARLRIRQERNVQVDVFCVMCIIPRALFSPLDAAFCAKFIKTLHTLGTQNWSTMLFLDKLFGDALEPTIDACTPAEAENLGRFLNELLVELSRWQATPQVYERECIGRKVVDGKVRFNLGFSLRTTPTDDVAATNDIDKECESWGVLTYSKYKKIMFKWHRKLSMCLRSCMKSSDYMHRRNAIIVLKNVSKVFPKFPLTGKPIINCVQDLSTNEVRDDLKLAATTLLGILRRESANWVDVSTFRLTEAERLEEEQERAKAAAKAKAEADKKAAEERKIAQEAEASKPAVEEAAVTAKRNEPEAPQREQHEKANTKEDEQVKLKEGVDSVGSESKASSQHSASSDGSRNAQVPAPLSRSSSTLNGRPDTPLQRQETGSQSARPSPQSAGSTAPDLTPRRNDGMRPDLTREIPRGPRSMGDRPSPVVNEFPVRVHAEMPPSRARVPSGPGSARQPLPPQEVMMNRPDVRSRVSGGMDAPVAQFNILNSSASNDRRAPPLRTASDRDIRNMPPTRGPDELQAVPPRLNDDGSRELSANAPQFVPSWMNSTDESAAEEKPKDKQSDREREHRERDKDRDRERRHERDKGREKEKVKESSKDKEEKEGEEKERTSQKSDSSHRRHRHRESDSHREHRSSRHRSSKEGDDKPKERSSRASDREHDRESRHRDRDRDNDKDRERRRRERDEDKEKQSKRENAGSSSEKPRDSRDSRSDRESRHERDDDRGRKHQRAEDGPSENRSEEKRRRTEETK